MTEVKFCPNCGAPKKKPTDQFCFQCGTNYEEKAEPSPVHSKNGFKRHYILIGIIVIIGILSIGTYLLFFASQPEDAVIQCFQYLDKGEYNQAVDLILDSSTMQPPSESDKAKGISSLIDRYGQQGEYIKIDYYKILSKDKIGDDKYKITLSMTVTQKGTFGQIETDTKTAMFDVVKVNGRWMFAFPSSSSTF